MNGTELRLGVRILAPVKGEFCANAYFHKVASFGRRFHDTTKQFMIMVREEMKSKHLNLESLSCTLAGKSIFP
jgi:hypothetical protein